jgi:hypothetical protein
MNDINIDDVGKGIMSIFVRFVGLFLLIAGVYVALHVMLKAMDLYENPGSIERFALAIEKGSNIDKSLSSFRDAVVIAPDEDGESPGVNNPETLQRSNDPYESHVRVSYFFAWIIILMLLMLIGSISLRAIKTGGELVLYDMQIKQFAKMLVKESSNNRN